MDHYRDQPTLLDESFPFLLEPPTTVVATQNVTGDPPPVTVSLRLPISPTPVPVGLAAAPTPIPLPAVAAAPALVAPDTADVEAPEPQVLERPYHPTQDVRCSASSDDSSINDPSLHARTLRDTPTYMKSGGQKLPAEAITTDRKSPLRPLSHLQSSHAISSAGSESSLNDSPRNISNAFEVERGPLLEPQSSEFMPPVDQGNITVFPNRLKYKADGDNSVDITLEKSMYLQNSCTTVTPERQQTQSSSTALPKSYDLRPGYHLGIIMRK